MAAVLINHRVADFAAWVKIFAEHGAQRQSMGATASIVWQAADDPNNVFILIKGVDPAKAMAFAQSADLKERMQQGGVLGQPSFTLLADGQKFPS
jgi:hypothetical protein